MSSYRCLVAATVSLLLLLTAACSDSGASTGLTDTGPDLGADGAAEVLPDLTPDGLVGRALDVEGRWAILSITSRDEATGGTLTLTRATAPASVRGEIVFASVDGAVADMAVRLISLQDGVLDDTPEVERFSATVDPATMAVEVDEGVVNVFSYVLAGDALTLTRQLDDGRDSGDGDGPLGLTLRRIPEPAGDVVGSWVLSSMTLPGGATNSPDDCVEDEPGEYETFSFNAVIDADYLLQIDSVTVVYADDDCSVVTETRPDEIIGAAEEEGSTLRWWMVNLGDVESSGMFIELAFERDGDILAATRNACLPAPDCDAETPIGLTFERVD